MLFCSFEPDHLPVETAKHPGPKFLKQFLKYSKAVSENNDVEKLQVLESVSSGMNIGAGHTSGHSDSPFEDKVKDSLVAEKFNVINNVSAGRFRIDLAIVHPKDPTRFILGIECDGAQFHQIESVRERDVSRQNLLESQGWDISRIWSRDYWRNPGKEIDKIVARINELLKKDSKNTLTNDSQKYSKENISSNTKEKSSDDERLNILKKHLDQYDKILKKNPNDEFILCLHGQCNYELKRYEDALGSFNSILLKHPNNEKVRVLKANCYFHQGTFKNAILEFDKILSINNNHVSANIGKGNSQMKLKYYSDALKCYAKVLDITPNNEKILMQRGICWGGLNDYSKSMMEFEKVEKINPSNKTNVQLKKYCKQKLLSLHENIDDSEENRLKEVESERLENELDTYFQEEYTKNYIKFFQEE